MFDTQQKSTGTGYTATVGLLIVAFVFIPAAMTALHPVGYLTLSLAIACSVICAGLAWFSWKKFSHLSMPSIATEEGRSK